MIQMQRIKKTVSRMELQKQKRNPTFSYIVACALNSSFKIVEYILYQFTWLRLIR